MVKIQNIENLFYSILTYTYLLPPILLFVYWNKLKQDGWSFWVPVYALFFFFLVFFEQSITVSKFSTRLYYQAFTFFEYLFFTGIFWKTIKNRIAQIIIVILSVAFSIFQIVYFFTERFKRIDSIPIGIESILILIFIFYFF